MLNFIKRTGIKISYIIDQENILKKTYKRKSPDVDEPHKGLFRKDKHSIANKNICQAKKWKNKNMNSPVEQIKERLSIEEIVSSYIKLEKAGANFKAKCPFHNEKHRPFCVTRPC